MGGSRRLAGLGDADGAEMLMTMTMVRWWDGNAAFFTWRLGTKLHNNYAIPLSGATKRRRVRKTSGWKNLIWICAAYTHMAYESKEKPSEINEYFKILYESEDDCLHSQHLHSGRTSRTGREAAPWVHSTVRYSLLEQYLSQYLHVVLKYFERNVNLVFDLTYLKFFIKMVLLTGAVP